MFYKRHLKRKHTTKMENNTQHTPGPWKSVKKAPMLVDDIEISIHTIETKFGPVARVIGSEANARLIAAAPDLLEALEGTMKALKRALDKFDPDNTDYEWIGEANEAIIKAKGPC